MPYYVVYTNEYDAPRTSPFFAPTVGKAKSEVWHSSYMEWGVPYTSVRARKVPAPAIDFSYINQYYGLNVRAGSLVKFDGKSGEVVGTSGPHLKVYMHEGHYKGRVVICHPTSEMIYES